MGQPTPVIKGLYAITPECDDTDRLLHLVESALQGGAKLLQYRSKSPDAALRLRQAESLRILTRQFSVPLIINDDVRLTQCVDADGVHLGITDTGLAEARMILGKRKIIGISCYNRLPLARAASALGADYLAFGSFYPSRVKTNAARADVGLLRNARTEFSIPLVAIGGITVQNALSLIQAGADAVAVISGLFDTIDVKSSAVRFSNLFI